MVIAVLVWAFGRTALIAWLQHCCAHSVVVGLVAAAAVAAATTRRKAGVRRELGQSWLAALPSAQSQLARVALAPLGLVALVVSVLIIATLAGLPLPAAAVILAAIAAGAAAGLVIGWLLPRGSAAPTPGSWYALVPRSRSDLRPTLLPLAHWPIAATRVWGRPSIRARWVLVVLLAVPLGTPAAKALAAAAGVLVGWYLLTLLVAVMRVAFAAAWWLAPTSIGILRFTGSLVYLAWLRQLLICCLSLAATDALGGASVLREGGAIAAAWLALCCLSGAGACGWALAPRSIAHSRLHRWMR
jgi:hypothetical protein